MSNKKIAKDIISYLNSKGKIKAALLSKLIKQFCFNEFKDNKGLSEDQLVKTIMGMFQEEIIDIIIPEPFSIRWEKKRLKDLEYFPNGVYYVRNFQDEMGSLNNGDYFDSRYLHFNDKKQIKNTVKTLESYINQYPKIKKKVIIFYSKGSLPLDIYGKNTRKYYDLIEWKKNISIEQRFKDKKIQYPLRNQRLDLSVIGKYRNSYMCFYITLIESLQKKIYDLEKENPEKYSNLIKKYTEKFAHYCQMYVNSDWVEILESNPFRWETFFKHFSIPIKILTFKFRALKFYGKVFDASIKLKVAVPIKKGYHDLIRRFKTKGLKILSDSKNYLDFGFNINIYLPSPSIEHFYFIAKYIFFYHLFLLFRYTFEYYLEEFKYKFSKKEKNLYRIFSPIFKDLFIVNRAHTKLMFKFYTYNPFELELIYNKYLTKKIKIIEKKLFTYFLMRSSTKH
jgi:hypothetical protein